MFFAMEMKATNPMANMGESIGPPSPKSKKLDHYLLQKHKNYRKQPLSAPVDPEKLNNRRGSKLQRNKTPPSVAVIQRQKVAQPSSDSTSTPPSRPQTSYSPVKNANTEKIIEMLRLRAKKTRKQGITLFGRFRAITKQFFNKYFQGGKNEEVESYHSVEMTPAPMPENNLVDAKVLQRYRGGNLPQAGFVPDESIREQRRARRKQREMKKTGEALQTEKNDSVQPKSQNKRSGKDSAVSNPLFITENDDDTPKDQVKQKENGTEIENTEVNTTPMFADDPSDNGENVEEEETKAPPKKVSDEKIHANPMFIEV